MEKNKRAQFFALYLVVLTLFMCGIVIGLWITQNGNAKNSLVSPRAVLDLRDQEELFRIKELELINESLKNLDKKNFGTEKFKEDFRKSFFTGLYEDEFSKEFLTTNIFFNGRDLSDEYLDESFFESAVYPTKDTYFDKEKFYFTRNKVQKFISLEAKNGEDKITYDVLFRFEFESKYLITLKDNNYIVEEIR